MSVSSSIAGVIGGAIDRLYRGPITSLLPQVTFRYLICGVANYFVLDTILYFIIYHYIIDGRYLDLLVVSISPHISSMILLFPITFLSGFFLNRHVAFRSTEDRARGQMVRYAISICGSVVVSYLSLKLLVEGCGVWATPAKVLASMITAIYSYMASWLYTFRKRGRGWERVQTENKQKDV